MPKSAVPIFPGRMVAQRVKRPTRVSILKAAVPRDVRQLPKMLTGVGVAICITGYLFKSAQLPGSTHLCVIGLGILFADLLFDLGVQVVHGRKRNDTTGSDPVACSHLVCPTPTVHEPVAEVLFDASRAPTVRLAERRVVYLDEQVEAAVQENVVQVVARERGARIVFRPVKAGPSGSQVK